MGGNDYVPAIEDTELRRNAKTKYWEIRWTIPAHLTGTGKARTRTRTCSTKDYNLAVTVRREYLSAASTTMRALSTPTIEKLIEAYAREHVLLHGIAPTQMESLKPIRRLLGSLEPGSLTNREIANYRVGRVGGIGGHRPVKPGTVRRELGALRAVLNWAQREGELPRDFVQPHIALPPEGQARGVTLDAKEEARLHRICEAVIRRDMGGQKRIALFVLIALNTAARAESIESLTWDRVDLKARLIDFRDKSVRATKKRRVAVPISDRLFRPLARAWIEQGKPKVGPVLGSFGSTRAGWEKLRGQVFTHLRDITRHDLRRTWATLAAQRGVSMFDIAGVLGDSVETVTKHYAMHSPGYLRDAINKRA
jgi:integrase